MTPFQISMRLGPGHHRDLVKFDALIAAMDASPGCADDVWLTTPFGFPSLEEHRANAAEMKKAADRLRAAGYHVTLQLANTVGHGGLGAAGSFAGFHSCMIGQDGKEDPMRSCPRDADFLQYVYDFVREYMIIDPEVVFLDDDLRLNMTKYSCFCPRCLGAFNRRRGMEYTPQGLYAAMQTDRALLDAWRDFGDEGLAGVAAQVARAATDCRPGTRIGLQVVSSFAYNPYRRICDAVLAVTGLPPIIRAGGLCYQDAAPREIPAKALDISRERTRLPDYITDYRPEIEGYPHVILNKTPQGFAVEAALDLAMSCTGLTVAALVMENEPADAYRPILQKLSACRRYFEQLSILQQTTRPAGPGVVRAPMPLPAVPGVLTESTPDDVRWLPDCGLPLSFLQQDAAAPVYLPREAAESVTAADLAALEDCPLLLTAEAVLTLQRRGLGDAFPLTVTSHENVDREIFTEECAALIAQLLPEALPPESGFPRPCPADRLPPWYWPPVWPVYAVACAPDVPHQVLGRYGQNGLPATVLYRSRSGAPVAVLGHLEPPYLPNIAKRAQLLAVGAALCGGALPACVTRPAQTLCLPRVGTDGKLRAVTVLNQSIDTAAGLPLRLDGAKLPARCAPRWMAMDGSETSLPLQGCTVTLPDLPPWTCGTLLL